MQPISFERTNCTYAERQPQYNPLPACKVEGPEGRVITCWRVGFIERLKILFTGRIYLSILTFNKPSKAATG